MSKLKIGKSGINEEELKRQYDKNFHNYRTLCEKMKESLELILKNHKIDVLGVYCRVKEYDSFLEKIERKGYNHPFKECIDICGLRILCYYNSDLQMVSDLIKYEFNVSEVSDKYNTKELNEFGYSSKHFVVNLKDEWLNYPALRKLKEYPAEIQVRTVLMHAWDEVSHELIYKNEENVPDYLKRNLYRLIASLEIIDEQFEAIKKDVKHFKDIIKSGEYYPLYQEINNKNLYEFLKIFFPGRNVSNEDNERLLKRIIWYNENNIEEKHITLEKLANYVNEYKGVLPLWETGTLYPNYSWSQGYAMEFILDKTNNDFMNFFAA